MSFTAICRLEKVKSSDRERGREENGLVSDGAGDDAYAELRRRQLAQRTDDGGSSKLLQYAMAGRRRCCCWGVSVLTLFLLPIVANKKNGFHLSNEEV